MKAGRLRRAAPILLILFLLPPAASTACARQPSSGEPRAPARPELDGARALQHVRVLVERGGRVPGSAGHRWTQSYIVRQLRLTYAEVEEVDFAAQTPKGVLAMKNIVGKIPGRSSDVVVLAGHYDALDREGFVGANDSGSSTALLLELARVLGLRKPNPVEVWVVFFDGEEALRQWGPTDGLYGSRYQASLWGRTGALDRIKAVIVLDMVGDKNLTIRRDANSTPWLTDLVWQVAGEKGHGQYFLDETIAIEDDHLPFRQAGVPAVDLIDFDYGPGNRYWHTPQDTADKLSAHSLQVVGEVVLETVERLGARWPGQD